MAKDSTDRKTREIPETKLFRSAYGPRFRFTSQVGDEVITKQSFKDECDINVIMRRYEKTGVVQSLERREARFLDCTAVQDYQEAMFIVAGAKSAFQEMPARLRARFDNDPARFLEFMNDKRNQEEAIALGLAEPPQEAPGPVRVEVVPQSVKVDAPGASGAGQEPSPGALPGSKGKS